MSAHSSLGASGAHRWIACPGCIQQTAALPHHLQNRGSVYAREGTAAHHLAAECLENDANARDRLGQVIDSEAECYATRPADDDTLFEVTDDMTEAVQVYLDEVRRCQKALGANVTTQIEVRCDLGWLREGMFGTADAVLTGAGHLVVYDYKHGKGVVVEVEENDQAMYYGLGAMREARRLGHVVKWVTLVIVQPRAPHADGPVRAWETTPEHLEEFGEMLGQAADATAVAEPELNPGDHCKFCPAQATCPAMRAMITKETAVAFSTPIELPESIRPRLPDAADPEQMARAMQLIPILDSWCKEVQGLVQRSLEAGVEVPGQKLVRKKANRRWLTQTANLMRALRRRGLKSADVYKPRELRSPAQIEKALKALTKGPANKDLREQLLAWLGTHTEKPEGGLTVARDDDPRPSELPERLEFPALEAGDIIDIEGLPESPADDWLDDI